MYKELQKKLRFILVGNYFVAAGLLGFAGVIKLNSSQVGDLLQFFFDHELLSLDQLVFISRCQPFAEIMLCIYALVGFGVRLRYTAYLMGLLYLFFAALIYYASEGYLFLPIDCGCFGEGQATMAIWLIVRNCVIGGLLFFIPKDFYGWTLFCFCKSE